MSRSDGVIVIHFRMLGPLEVSGPLGRTNVLAPRQRVVIVMLLLAAGHVVPAERLAEAVWDESPPATARCQIQICVSVLRRKLTEVGLAGLLQTYPPGYALAVDPSDVDLLVFQHLLAEARRRGEEGDLDAGVALFGKALELWRGSALAGVGSRLVQACAPRLEEMRSLAIEEYIDLRLRQGEHNELVAELVDLVATYPLREHLRARLMLALYRSGRQAEALSSYREARQTLIDELGIEPGTELRELERAILVGEVDRPPVPAPPRPIRAVGSCHRLSTTSSTPSRSG